MDRPSSVPVGPSGEPATNFAAAATADHPAYLHHAGSPSFLVLTALGVVFGDIGTSPLYAFQVALAGLGHPAPSAT
jgi:KUP system potassium uptake protein